VWEDAKDQHMLPTYWKDTINPLVIRANHLSRSAPKPILVCIALQKILESKVLKLTELVELKNNIETEIRKVIADLKNKYLPEKDVEVVFSIADFFLLEPTKL
jgi:hypothetical protein